MTETMSEEQQQAAERARADKENQELGDRAMGTWVGIAIIAVVWCLLAGAPGKDTAAVGTALFVVTVALAVLWLSDRKRGGFLQVLRDPGGRLSTSSTQAGVWTLVLGFGFVFFAARLAWGAMTHDEFRAATDSFTPTYLLLLGGPFAAAAGVRLNYSVRKDDGSVQKTSEMKASLDQIIKDDAGRTSLNDAQFFVFNLVAIGVFIVMLAKDPSRFPLIPDTLVGLTSVSALAYVTTKAVTNQKPVITTIVRTGTSSTDRGGFHPGSHIEVRGYNFVPEGATDLSATRVRFKMGTDGEAWEMAALPRSDHRPDVRARSVKVAIPDGLDAGTYDVQVITVAGAETERYALRVVAGNATGRRTATT